MRPRSRPLPVARGHPPPDGRLVKLLDRIAELLRRPSAGTERGGAEAPSCAATGPGDADSCVVTTGTTPGGLPARDPPEIAPTLDDAVERARDAVAPLVVLTSTRRLANLGCAEH